MARRRSGLQGDVLQLYRGILRAAAKKDAATLLFAKERFRESAAAVKRSEFKRIEFLLRQGHKRLKLLSMPGVTSAASLVGAHGGHATNPARKMHSMRMFSTTTTTMNANSMMMTARAFSTEAAPRQVSIKFLGKAGWAARRDPSAAAPERAPAAAGGAGVILEQALVHSEGAVDLSELPRGALHGRPPITDLEMDAVETGGAELLK
jgi:hypothetical protein